MPEFINVNIERKLRQWKSIEDDKRGDFERRGMSQKRWQSSTFIHFLFWLSPKWGGELRVVPCLWSFRKCTRKLTYLLTFAWDQRSFLKVMDKQFKQLKAGRATFMKSSVCVCVCDQPLQADGESCQINLAPNCLCLLDGYITLTA